jgi:hypothetical protein
MKKIFFIIIFIESYINSVFASAEPNISCEWLPWCGASGSDSINFIWTLVAELIKYVAVVAVMALIAAGFMYIFSSWEDEKTKKARKWIIWSLVAVFLSISGYFMINLINEASIDL